MSAVPMLAGVGLIMCMLFIVQYSFYVDGWW